MFFGIILYHYDGIAGWGQSRFWKAHLSLNLYIDGMWFRHTGIGRIYENLLKGLVESEEVECIHTVVSPGREKEFLEDFSSRKIMPRFVSYPYDYREILRKGLALRDLHPKPDLFYFPSFNVPYFLDGKVVSTVCDLIPLTPFFDLPWHMRARFRFAVRHALARSVRTVCISQATRDHVAKEFGAGTDSLEVIHPPLDFPVLDCPAGAGEDRPIVEGDYLLYVGNRNPHKNLGCLLDAFRMLAHDFPGFRVVLAGPRMRKRDDVDMAREAPDLRDRLVEIPSSSDEEIHNLYRHARAFVFPTLIEGFGIPPVEALWHGVPAVCSDIPVVREVCGDAVRYANPRDPSDFARAIRRALREPRDTGRREAGREWARRYSRDMATRRYLDLFRRCLDPVA